MKKLFCCLIMTFPFVFFGQEVTKNQNLIVLVKYKAQADKTSEAKQSLITLVEKVKKEPHYKSIIIHVDPTDSSNILLYEEWASEEYYKGEHMRTAHLLEFINQSRNFLSGPPEITFWKKINKKR